MSQFAHGIRTLNFSGTQNEEENDSPKEAWLLGQKYTHLSSQSALYRHHFESIFWFTYRRDFAIMAPYEYTSDSGWGCMLRSAQMILAQALQRHHFGSNWRLRSSEASTSGLSQSSESVSNVLRWFIDSPDEKCFYSIHQMVKIGMQYEKLPGEWYGPTTASLVLRDLVNLHSKEYQGQLSMYVPQEGVVYTDEVLHLCTELPKVNHVTVKASVDTDTIPGGETFFDPLLNPPTVAPCEFSNEASWTTAILILIPLRLGLDRLNEMYMPAMTQIFAFPQSVGVIGGKRGHSVYFVGTSTNELHLLDPHTVHPAAEWSAGFPSITQLSTLHCQTPLVIGLENIDPSLALGFYCRDFNEYVDFQQRVEELEQRCDCPFSISTTRPQYDMNSMNCCEDSGESGGEGSSLNGDEDYVLI